MAGNPPTATGVVFSNAKLPETEKEKNESTTTTVQAVSDSAKSSPAPSIRDAEKAETTLEEEEKALARYLVPALEKGQKNARLKPPSLWIRFRVWYNPYRMVRLASSSG